MRGVEPPTFALRMRAINLLPSLIGVGILYVNQQVMSGLELVTEAVALIEIHQNIAYSATQWLHGGYTEVRRWHDARQAQR